VAAGEAILDVGYERYAEIARATERALEQGLAGPAMAELPYVLAEIGEPSARGLIRGFLTQKSPDTVAAGIEALASLGDPAVIEDLRPLLDDQRMVQELEMDDGPPLTVGELAQAAIDELSP
jgi:HEAT repeat protein